MRPATFLATLFCILSAFSGFVSKAQCPAVLPPATCTGSEPLVIANEILAAGTTKWYYGPVSTMNSLTLRGGKLIVCGDLTIDKFYMDSGQIIINPGARFVIGSGLGEGLNLKGGSSIYNHGTLEIQRNLSLENGWATPATPNIIVNARWASVFKMSNQYFVINNANSWFVNNGLAQFWGIITDPQSSAGSVCLGESSTTTMAILINKVANAYRVSAGNACVYVHQFSEFFGSLTNSPSLFACLSAGHTSNSGCIPFGCQPNAWGSAQVFTNCSNCAALGVLPMRFANFLVTEKNNLNILKWELDNAAADYTFYVERSADGKNFDVLDSLPGSVARNFSYIDASVPAGLSYYRIRCMQLQSGRLIISKIISTSSGIQPGGRVFPSPFSHTFFIELSPGQFLQKIIVHDFAGKRIPVDYRQEGHKWRVIPLGAISRQLLIVEYITSAGTGVQKIISN
jgi:hypothetical protein